MARGQRVDIVKIIVDGAEVDAKKCTKCGEVKALAQYYRKPYGVGLTDSSCKTCRNAADRERYRKAPEKKQMYREANREDYREYSRNHYASDPCYYKNRNAQYRKSFPERKAAEKHVYTARKRNLPNCLPRTGYEDLVQGYHNKCAISGVESGISLDHFIPLSLNHGGSYIGNVYPLCGALNSSKQAANPFEWFADNAERFGLDPAKFDELVTLLAHQNGITPQELRDFVYWCFANKRTTDEVLANNQRYGYKKPSLELWRETTGLAFPIRVDFGDLSLHPTQITDVSSRSLTQINLNNFAQVTA